ncbi:MAG: phospholipase D-like domain-containing protein [Nanoarchaeota archaeon]
MKYFGIGHLIIILIILLASGCSTGEVAVTDTSVHDQGEIEVYFCPSENCEQALVSFLDSAEKSIHCALFDVGLKSVQEKLLEKQKEIEVKVVTDDDYLKKFNYSFVKADTYGLMHDKFCIVDGKKLSTGSMNPTDNDAHKNNNNLLLIDSAMIAHNYDAEFQEMWNGEFKRGSRVKNPEIFLDVKDKLDGKDRVIKIENYFCPEDACAEQVKEELEKAERSIYFMTFSFTHDGIANILLLKNVDGIEVKGVMELKQISEYSEFDRLLQNKIDVHKDGNKYNLHHKVFIVDEKTVITGSFNPTANGDQRNDENVIIVEDGAIAKEFVEEFWKVYEEAASP